MEKLTIWIDSDACPKPIKEVIYRASHRLQLPVILVANSYMSVPAGTLVRSIQVDKGADVADQYIVDHSGPKDIVVTQDIPLASKIVEKGAYAINPRGELYTEDNISERLAMRDLMKELRDGGMVTGGPAPFNPKDVESFANSLNRILTKLVK